jgi:enoyl-CoA hydratase/carnithine racemase
MALTGPDILLYEVIDSVAVVTMNRPERMNAMSTETMSRLNDAFLQVEQDPGVRAMILTATGDKAFSAGGDLKEFSERKLKNIHNADKPGMIRYTSATYVWEVSKPVIAAVNGFALAGGFKLALACDMRVACEEATFGITEALVGRAAPWSVPMLHALPSAIALELLTTGARLSAQRAYELGFVNRVVPRGELMETAMEIGQRVARCAPLTVKAHKAFFYRSMDVGRAAAYMIADDLCRVVYDSEDCQEGQRAFAEKRPPQWKGR